MVAAAARAAGALRGPVGRAEFSRRFTGRKGRIYGVQRFGASGPAGDLAKQMGFTGDQLAAAVLAHLG